MSEQHSNHLENGTEPVGELDEEAAEKVAAEIEGETSVHRTDVTRADDVAALVRAVQEEQGRLDVMVNNAGVGISATTLETSEEDYERVMDVCARGLFWG